MQKKKVDLALAFVVVPELVAAARHKEPYTLHTATYTLHQQCTLHPTPYTLHPAPGTGLRRSARA